MSRSLSSNIALVLRHKDPNKDFIIERILKQAKEKGLSYVLCKVSPEAKLFCNMARQVLNEVHRARMFIRLDEVKERKVLYGEFLLEHDTIDLVMSHYTGRFPQYTIMLIIRPYVYISKGKEIFKEDIGDREINLPVVHDEFKQYWLDFYNNQYIPERRNMKLFQKNVPKKYWKYMFEIC